MALTRALVLGLCVVGVLAVGGSATAQENPETIIAFESVALAEAFEQPTIATDLIQAGGETRFVSLDGSALMDELENAETVRLELFEDVSPLLSLTESVDGVSGSRYWAASGQGVSASFTEVNGWVDGRVVAGDSLYRVLGVGSGVSLLAEDLIAYRDEGEVVTPTTGTRTAGTPTASSNVLDGQMASAGPSAVIASSTSSPVVDVLAWYDSAALAIFGSSQAAEAAIAGAYNNANAAAERSGVDVSFNVVDLDFVSWSPPADDRAAFIGIGQRNDGRMDEIHAVRDSVGADLVAVVGGLNQYCGIASLPEWPPPPVTSWSSFSYTDAGCIGGNLTLVHETAHNLGAGHDAGADQPGPGTFRYSQAFVNPTEGYRTIMAFDTACPGCQRIPYFSGQVAEYEGNPTGGPRENNARTMNRLAAAVAGHRTTGGSAKLITADVTQLEGDTGNQKVRIWFTLDKPAIAADGSGFITMSVTTVNGTATRADNDYRYLNRQIRWGPGQTSQFVDFRIVSDRHTEPTEYFELKLTGTDRIDLDDGRIRIFIENDDEVVPMPIVSAASKTVTETESNQTVKVTVELDRPAPTATRVRYRTVPGSARFQDDYVHRSGIVSFPKGRTTATISVPIRGDFVQEPTEFFNLELFEPRGLTLGGDATITIEDNDDPPPTVTVVSQSVIESERNQPVRITFELDRAVAYTTRVRYATVADTASAGVDFVNRVGTVTFARGQTSKTINITVRGDRSVEPTEQFSIQMNSPVGLQPVGVGTVTILDND